MQKLFRKTLIFLITLGVILNRLGTLARTQAPLDDWQSELEQQYDQLETQGNQLQAVTMGNSHSGAIDYSVLDIEGQSLGLAAEDLFEMEQYILLLERKAPNIQTVFITLSYYSFARDNKVSEAFRSRRIGFYSNLPIWMPIQNDIDNFLMGKLDSFTHILSVTRSDNWKEVWPELINPSPKMDEYDGIRTVSDWGVCEHYSAEMLDVHAQEKAFRNVQSTQQMISAHPNLEQDSFLALSRSIERLQQRGVRVVLFTPTYYEKYNEYFVVYDPGILLRMQEAISRITALYSVDYFDFSNDPELSMHPELFYNSDHLGRCGQIAMTKKLRQAMENKGSGDQ